MTGDETNKQFNPFTQIGPMKDPVASNTGKELKPCPFCGGRACGSNGFYQCEADPELCHFSGFKIDLSDWQEAWAHKRIAELKAKNKDLSDSRDAAIVAYREELESQKHCYRLLENHRASLESSLEELKKRNEHIKTANDALNAWAEDQRLQIFKLEKKLKIAEDKLAGK